MVPGPGGLRASPEHAGVGSCSQDRSHTPTEVPGASMQAEPPGQQTGAHRVSRRGPTGSADGAHRVSRRGPIGQGSPAQSPQLLLCGPPSRKRGVRLKGTPPTPTPTPTPSGLATLCHLNYPLNRSVLTSSERGAVRPWPTARENRPHRLTPPPRYAHPRLRSWALPTSEGWPAVPAACGPSSDPADTDMLGCQCPLVGPSTSPHLPQADGPSSSSSSCLTEESPCTSCDPCSGPRRGR